MAKKVFGPTPQNRQHALYLFGADGPEFHLLCLRILLVFSCFYSSQLVVMFIPGLARDEGTTDVALIAYCLMALIPGECLAGRALRSPGRPQCTLLAFLKDADWSPPSVPHADEKPLLSYSIRRG